VSNFKVSSDGTIDEYVRGVLEKNPNMLIPWWFIGAYTYEQGRPVISDALFDEIAIKLGMQWEDVNHYHKEHLDPTILKSSIAARVWPERVKGSCQHIWNLIDQYKKG
jgi:hypothetical protein